MLTVELLQLLPLVELGRLSAIASRWQEIVVLVFILFEPSNLMYLLNNENQSKPNIHSHHKLVGDSIILL